MIRGAFKRAKPEPPSGVLLVIAALMIGSGLIRATFEAGPAFARENPVEPAGQSAKVHMPEDLQQVLQELQTREALLKQREEAFLDRMKALEIADRSVARKLVELQEAEASLRASLAVADSAAENDLVQLTEVYQNMKPKEAAALFEAMDPTFAAGFLGRMEPDRAAAVMAGLSPQVAYTISVVMAGRNARAPKE